MLEISPGHPGALKLLGLALTDRFPTSWMTVFDEALAIFKQLASEYRAKIGGALEA